MNIFVIAGVILISIIALLIIGMIIFDAYIVAKEIKEIKGWHHDLNGLVDYKHYLIMHADHPFTPMSAIYHGDTIPMFEFYDGVEVRYSALFCEDILQFVHAEEAKVICWKELPKSPLDHVDISNFVINGGNTNEYKPTSKTD